MPTYAHPTRFKQPLYATNQSNGKTLKSSAVRQTTATI